MSTHRRWTACAVLAAFHIGAVAAAAQGPAPIRARGTPEAGASTVLERTTTPDSGRAPERAAPERVRAS